MSENAEREALCRYSVLLEGDELSDEAEKFDLILVRYSIFLYSTNAEDSWLMLARILKDEGARRVGLVAPYLPYMRQDHIFHPGEGLTSLYFADLISRHFDWLVTVDPHLHRYPDLSAVYSIPSVHVRASTTFAGWIRDSVVSPAIVGPDSESAQWVEEIATLAGALARALARAPGPGLWAEA